MAMGSRVEIIESVLRAEIVDSSRTLTKAGANLIANRVLDLLDKLAESMVVRSEKGECLGCKHRGQDAEWCNHCARGYVDLYEVVDVNTPCDCMGKTSKMNLIEVGHYTNANPNMGDLGDWHPPLFRCPKCGKEEFGI